MEGARTTVLLAARLAGKIWLALQSGPTIPLIILTAVIVAGIFGAWIQPHDPIQMDLTKRLLPPFWAQGGNASYPLGTDTLGRDILSRIIGGARSSLIVGFSVVGLAAFVGCAVALLSGYFGRWIDAVLMRLTDGMLSMPFLVVATALAGVLGPSLKNMVVVLVIFGWASYARILRGEVLRIRDSDFILLARVAGSGSIRIMWRHIFPNIFNTLIVIATLQLGVTIIAAASLSFLGLGIPPPHPSWGSMLAEGRGYIASAWWIVLLPGLAIMLTVLACNLLGDWLRDRLDPRLRQL